MFALSLVSVALLAGHASASAIQARDALDHFLYSRQDGGFNPASIPQQCQTICAGAASVLSGQGCQTNACLCTASVNTGFQQCLNCVLSLSPPDASLIQQSQAALVQYEDACSQVGIPLSSLTISGFTGGVATATGASGASGVSIPPNTDTDTGIVFFSTSGSTPTAPLTPITSATGSSPTRTVIGPSDTPATTSGSGTGAGSGSGAASSGERSFVTMGVLGAGLVGGAMMVLGL